MQNLRDKNLRENRFHFLHFQIVTSGYFEIDQWQDTTPGIVPLSDLQRNHIVKNFSYVLIGIIQNLVVRKILLSTIPKGN